MMCTWPMHDIYNVSMSHLHDSCIKLNEKEEDDEKKTSEQYYKIGKYQTY